MRTEAENLFQQTMSELTSLIDKFTPLKLNEIPYQGSWTAGQVGDHLFQSYGVINTLNGNVESTTRPVDQKIPEVKELFLNYQIKMESPREILPSNDYINKSVLVAGLKERISQFHSFIGKEDLSLVCTDFAIPEYGPFTRLEWVYFTIYHTTRHLNQLERIREIVSSPQTI